MKPLDWLVLGGSIAFIIAYGLWKARHSDTTRQFLLAGKTMPWYAMALSIMATQASAITFISTTGQAYVDGMRFVQFYFGLPLAMIVLSATVVPIFHRANVYTAYEYLEQRFDAKTRALVSVIFLIQRGLAVGVALSAPAIVLTVILGWPDRYTSIFMGSLVVLYTALGGVKAVTWTDFQQMIVMMAGLFISLAMAVVLLPPDVGFLDALRLAGAAGRLNAVVTSFDWNDRYNLWNGILGGMFLALAYFGCDQSQVQRYLTGKSIAQSRLSLLFNAVAKVPMQFLILLTGVIVFVFYTFEQPPVTFHPGFAQRIESSPDFEHAFAERRDRARAFLAGTATARDYRDASLKFEQARKEAAGAVNDTNYIFLNFVTRHLPAGLVGLVMAAIFAAAMSTISAEINSLATVSVIDIYQRFVRPGGTDRHYLSAARLATVFWGAYAVVTATTAANVGSLIERVNVIGSLFYGGLLGVFVLAFYFPRVRGTPACIGVLCGEAAIFAAHWFSDISFLWYNVIGCLVVVAVGLLASTQSPARRNGETA
jgi:Na+/proline symporter